MANRITRADIQNKAILTVCSVALGAPASYVIQKMLAAWKVLDPVSDAIGRWLRVTVSADQMGWTIALIVVGVAFGILLWRVWRPVHVHHLERNAEGRATPSLNMAVTRAPKRDATLAEALAYAELGDWGRSFLDAAASAKNQANENLARFRQLAHDGTVTAWGKRSNNSVFELIPPAHWTDHNIEWFDLLRGTARTENVMHTPPSPFLEIMVCRAEFEREWPHVE